ncbi:MAG: metallopeptidase TldD-related protein [Clostridia bacterium]|nr:metallopeptidase TldD-related protein [Clostridia bacterium]
MDINILRDTLFERAENKGFSACEIYYNENSAFKVSVYKGKIEKYQNSQSGGFCFRGIYKNKMGYYFSETIDDVDIDGVIENTIENAEILSGDDEEFIFEGSSEYARVNTFNDDIQKMSAEDKINAAVEMEKKAMEYDSRITVNSSVVVTGSNLVYISNNKGLNLSEKSNYIMAHIEVMASSGTETKEKGELWLGNNIEEFKPNEIAEKAAEKVIFALGGSSVESGKRNIIIKNEVFADILGCFISNFYAENVQKGFSLLKDKIGEKIADYKITVTDNPLLENGYITTAFDSEGVATYSKNVIEDGILKTYLYNLKSAYKDNVKSTGNGFKFGFKSAVSTSATNFYINKGSMSFEKLVEKMGEGIIITDVAGLHSGANAVSGDFSFAAEGFKAESGRITSPVNQITIAGNFYEILKNIDAVGSDLKFNSSAVGSPSLIIKNINVSGL